MVVEAPELVLGRKGEGGFMEELFIISGNFLVQVTYGVYMVFLNGVFNAGVNPLFLVVFGNSVTAVVVLPFALAFEKCVASLLRSGTCSTLRTDALFIAYTGKNGRPG